MGFQEMCSLEKGIEEAHLDGLREGKLKRDFSGCVGPKLSLKGR